MAITSNSSNKIIRYAPVDECIYCGAVETDTAKLSDEHVIPFGLNGRHVLPRASCSACAKITSKFELDCLRKGFGRFRAQHGFRSRKGHAHETTIIERNQSGLSAKRDISIHEVPRVLALPEFAAPEILHENMSGSTTAQKGSGRIFIEGQRPRTLDGSGEVGMEVSFPPKESLARMLAKIAYGFVASTYSHLEPSEWKTFTFPTLVEIIICNDTRPWHLVGCDYSGQDISSSEDSSPHAFEFVKLERPDGRNLAAFRIRLFSELNTPVYLVVLGEIEDSSRT